MAVLILNICMKISELLIEAIVKTKKGPIIRAQNRLQIESSLIKSEWRELRAIILPNQMWYVDSSDMIHYEMARELKEHTTVDLTDGIGVFIRDRRGHEHPVRNDSSNTYYSVTSNKSIRGDLMLTSADYGLENYHKISNYPIIKRFGLYH